MVIAIDGYSSTGKSSLAKKLASQYGFLYIDTGAMYRMVALKVLREGWINGKKEISYDLLEKNLPLLNIDFKRTLDGKNMALLNGEVVETEIRTMAIDSASQFRPLPPPAFNVTDKNSEYYKHLMMVKNAGDSLTEEQKHIANFWDDNPFKVNVTGHAMFSTKKFSPPGHWMSIVGIANKTAKSDFNNAVYAYAKTAIALFDAFIHTWDAKYTYKTVRPETVINKYIDPNWRPLLQTPAFPEYTCGHSTVSSAAAEALTSVFGDNFAYTDSTELEFGIENRSFKSFRHAAEENNWARFYGGIHFHNSCITSTEKGQALGNYIVSKLKMKN